MSTSLCENQLRCEGESCPPFYLDCDYIFEDVTVTPAREGGTIVQWILGSSIRDEGTYEYSLQVGNAGVPDAKAWRTVQTGTDTCCFMDPRRRLPGVHSFTHYRLKLQTGEGIYFSRPLHTLGKLNYADWKQYESVLRAEWIQLSKSDGVKGTLLKRKISGIRCPRCVDFATGEVKDGGCKICYGTGKVGGYYLPVPCFYINIEPSGSTISSEANMQGQVATTQVVGRGVAAPLLASGDVWISEASSERFRILQLKHVVEVKGVPVVYQIGMERIPFSDVVYSFPLK